MSLTKEKLQEKLKDNQDLSPIVLADLDIQAHNPKSNASYSFQPNLANLSQNEIIAISGATSGFLAGVIVCPLDVVKTRLQAQGAMLSLGGDSKIVPKYNGFADTLHTIVREEGVRGLYRGLVPITIGYLPTWMIYFSVYERAKKFYPHFLQEHFNITYEPVHHFCSAITAGIASSTATNPIWVVKTRLMIQTGNGGTIYGPTAEKRDYYKGTFDALRTMYRNEGLGSFYSGLVPSLFGLFHVAIHFPVYEKLKLWLDVEHTEDPYKRLALLIQASSVSKMVASTLTYPHEILRTRLQIPAAKKKKLIPTIVHIYKNEGARGFYSGFFTNLARTVPASAVTLVSFEYFRVYLERLAGIDE